MPYEGSAHLADVPRALLLGAAGEVVREQGYDRLTVSRLASRAGVSTGTFHNLFDGPEDCFLQAFEEAVLNAEGIAKYEYGRTQGAWRVKVRAALGAVLAFLDERPDLRAVLVLEPVKAGPRVAERYAQTVRRVARALHESAVGTTENGDWLTLTDAECTVQTVLSLFRGRLLELGCQEASSSRTQGAWCTTYTSDRGRRNVPLLGVLMSMVVLRYEGGGAAEEELAQPAVTVAAGSSSQRPRDRNDVLKALNMRVTYRTLRVLEAIVELDAREGSYPCNRQIADLAGVTDEGQISKLLRRLQDKGLIEEVTGNVGKQTGMAYEWRLTSLGEELERAAKTDSTREDRRPRHERRGPHR